MRPLAGWPAGMFLVAVVVLLVVPTGAADENTLVARLPLDLDGDVRADALGATVHVAGDRDGRIPRLEMTFTAMEAQIVVTNWTTNDRADCDSPLGPVLCSSTGNSNEAMSGSVRNAEFLLREIRPDFNMVLFDGAMAGANYTAYPLEDPRLDVTVRDREASYSDEPVGLDFSHPISPDTIAVTDAAMRYEVRGDFTFMVYGAELTTVTPDRTYTYDTGSWERTRDAGGAHLTSEKTTQYVRVSVKDALLTLRVAGVPQNLYAPVEQVILDVDGGISAEGAAGTIQVGDQAVRSRGDRVHAEGHFTLTPTYVVPGSNKQVVFAMAGEIDTLAVGADTYLGDEAVVAVAATGLGVLLAGLGAYFWPTVKTGLVAPLYAKLTKDKVLDQETRSLVHAKVEQDPGCQVKQVAESLDISWTTAAYHLRVLSKMGLVVGKKNGRHEHYFVAGSRAAAGHEVVSALQNDTARRILELVLRNPGIIQKDLCDELHIAASTASGHLTRLRDVGAVREEREWKKRRYYAGEALQKVPLHLGIGTPGVPVQHEVSTVA